MNINKIITISGIIIIILLISVPTAYKVLKTHNEHLYEATYEKIINAAKKCYYESICLDEKTTLKTLYDKEYLERISNPVTKEFYSEESYVKRVGKDFEFIVSE